MQGILKAMGTSFKHIFRRAVTFQYPEEKRILPPRFRGALAIRGVIDVSGNGLSPEIPPCQAACPAGVPAGEQNTLIAEGDPLTAFQKVQERNILPGVLGRICHHPCEYDCTRGQYDQAISIRALHRVVSGAYFKEKRKPLKSPPKSSSKKGLPRVSPAENEANRGVAIIGSGPSGLAAAYDLAKEGYSVTIFEKSEHLGGMLAQGVPRYRLSREILNREIEDILSLGIEVKLKTEIGKDILFKDLRKEYQAILIGVGLPLSRSLPLEGVDLEGVLLALPFLEAVNNGKKVKLGRKVIVIGGGNVAVDVARCARRLSPEVSLACLESRAEMPSFPWEIREAEEEGVKIHPSKGPKRFLGKNGKVTGVEFMECLSVVDEKGRFSPVCDEKKLYTLKGDTVIISIGQGSELPFLKDTGVNLNERGQLIFDPVTLETTLEGVFASGEVITGPGSCIDSIASGHHAAESILRFLKGEDLKEGRLPFKLDKPKLRDWEEEIPPISKEESPFISYKTPDKPVSERKEITPLLPIGRRKIPKSSPKTRVKSFTQIERGLSPEQSNLEAWRCLRCESKKCVGCAICTQVCPADAISQVITQGNLRKIEEYNLFLDRCIFCGLCVEHCPTKTLTHTLEYELSVYKKDKLTYQKQDLLRELTEENCPSTDEVTEDEVSERLWKA